MSKNITEKANQNLARLKSFLEDIPSSPVQTTSTRETIGFRLMSNRKLSPLTSVKHLKNDTVENKFTEDALHDENNNIVIGTYNEIFFLASNEKLNDFIDNEDMLFNILVADLVKNDKLGFNNSLISLFIASSKVLLDLRYEKLFDYESKFANRFMRKKKYKGVYTGSLDSEIAAEIQKFQLIRETTKIIHCLQGTLYKHIPIPTSFSPYETKRIIEFICLENNKKLLSIFDKTEINSSVNVDFILMPSNNQEIIDRTKLIERVIDLGALWIYGAKIANEEKDFRKELEKFEKTASQKDNMNLLFYTLELISKYAAIDVLLDSYIDGVPVEDIIA